MHAPLLYPPRPRPALPSACFVAGRVFHRHPGLLARSPARAASPLPPGSPGSTGREQHNFGAIDPFSGICDPMLCPFPRVFRDLGLRLAALLGVPYRCDPPCAQRRALFSALALPSPLRYNDVSTITLFPFVKAPALFNDCLVSLIQAGLLTVCLYLP